MEIGTLIVFEVLCPAGTVDVWDMNKPYKALSNCLTLQRHSWICWYCHRVGLGRLNSVCLIEPLIHRNMRLSHIVDPLLK